MADNETTAAPNGNGNGAMDAGDQPQVAVVKQYLKDLSVENPSSPSVYQWETTPSLDVQFNLNSIVIGDDFHELSLKIEATARSDNGVHFVVDMTYGGLFLIRNLPDEAITVFLLTEAPRLLFPFARQIVADAVQHCGFPAFLIDPIDFHSIYLSQMQQQQAEGGPAEVPTGEPSPSDA
jgi:preprotein translocase subunit SecB